MTIHRREFIAALAPAALWVREACAMQLKREQDQKPPKLGPSQQEGVPKPPKGWPGDDGEPPFPRPSLKANEQKIHDDVERLFALASELRDSINKTDSSNVLSLGILRKASEIEKLAKQIRDLAHG